MGVDPTSTGALAPIVARKHLEVSRLRCGAAALWTAAARERPARGMAAVLRGGTVVAEMKRRSPSAGELRPALDPVAVARGYAAAGAAALSVLTDGPDFGGSLDDLAAVRAAVAIPLLRKDFTIDPIQVAETRVAGADCVLLIAAVLGPEGLEACMDAAARCGLEALVEVHDEAEARTASALGARLVGVNNRDLKTLRTDLATFARLRPLLPSGAVVISESGVRGPADVRRLVRDGADAVLVGEVLMRHPDPASACAELVAAAREAGSGAR